MIRVARESGIPVEKKADLLLEVRDLTQEFYVRSRPGVIGGVVHAVSDVSLSMRSCEALGIVGETGCGKSTLARSILQMPRPKSGEVIFDGRDLMKLRSKGLREARRRMQVVFQDPFSSLDPKMTVQDIVEEPLVASVSKSERSARVENMLNVVGLTPSRFSDRHPRQLSGGQCQRVAIARALTVSPDLVVCDEPVSSLDVLVQAQILNLFEELRSSLQIAYLFISHDLAVVKQVSDRVAVMYLGRICEVAPTTSLFEAPFHPYTAALLEANPSVRARKGLTARGPRIQGEPPSPVDPPSGCRFRTRCPLAQERCAEEVPPLVVLADGRELACHFPLGQ